MKQKKKHGKVSEEGRIIVPVIGIERNNFAELFVQPTKYNIIPFDERFHKPIMMFTPSYLNKSNGLERIIPGQTSEGERDIRPEDDQSISEREEGG